MRTEALQNTQAKEKWKVRKRDGGNGTYIRGTGTEGADRSEGDERN